MNERLEALRALMDSPAANPTAAALGIAMLVLGLLAVIVVLLAWAMADRPGKAARRPAAKKKRPLKRRSRSTRSGRTMTLVLAFATVAVGYATTSSSTFCAEVCHAMAVPGDSWQQSAHARVSCIRCHEGTPGFSAPQGLLSRTRSAIGELSGRQIGQVLSLPPGRCLGCHSAVTRDVVTGSNGVAMDHRHPLDAGAACDDCHGAQGHEKPGAGPSMATCLLCHDGRTAPTTCATCHHKATDTLIEAEDTRFGKIELPGKPTCDGCHSLEKCDECHGLRMPHPEDFSEAKNHAKAAGFQGKDRVCYGCHVFNDCTECHDRFDAHVPNWIQEHKRYTRDTTWCRGCHTTPDMCGLCHDPDEVLVPLPSRTITHAPTPLPATHTVPATRSAPPTRSTSPTP